jgi:uncharacterized protein YaeQ
MALTASMHHVEISLSDVDRGIYESLDLRIAQHPSESMRYMLTRTLAYCLSYESGIAFSKGGLSSTDEPPVSIKDPTGIFLAWIDVGSPSAERLHKASKAARRVAIFTSADLNLLRKEASTKAIHKVEAIEVFWFDSKFLDAIESKMQRNTTWDVTRNDGQLYVGIDGQTFELPLPLQSLVASS